MMAMTKRNLLVFFRDKASVFFSLLSVFIIIGLYVLFLGNVIVSGMEDIPGARALMDNWIMAGLLAVAGLTSTMGAFGTMVDDRHKKIIKDFSASPVSRWQLAGGYIVSAFLVGVIMSVITLVLAEIYIVAGGGELISALTLLKVLGVILLSVLSGSSMMYFLISFFKSQNAFAVASTVVGTLVGFLTGIYIPVGNLPSAVQLVVKIFPVSHAGSLFRQLMMEQPMTYSFNGAPAATVDSFKTELGVVFHFGSAEAGPLVNILVLLATTAVFYGLAVLNISRKSK